MGAPRVVSLSDGSERSDTPFMKKASFEGWFAAQLIDLFSKIAEHSGRRVNIVIPGLDSDGGILDISVATEIKRQLTEYEVSIVDNASDLKKDIKAALAQLGAMLGSDGVSDEEN